MTCACGQPADPLLGCCHACAVARHQEYLLERDRHAAMHRTHLQAVHGIVQRALEPEDTGPTDAEKEAAGQLTLDGAA